MSPSLKLFFPQLVVWSLFFAELLVYLIDTLTAALTAETATFFLCCKVDLVALFAAITS
jgi:hypothetical protein